MKLNIQKFAGETWGLTPSFSDYKYNTNGELIQVTLTINSTHNIGSIYDIDDDGNENYAYSSWENYYASDSYPHSTTPYIKRTFYNLNNLKGVKVTTYETSTTQSQTITYNFKMSSNEEEKTTYITKNSGTAVLKGNVVNDLSSYDWNNAPSVGAVRNYLESSAVLHQSDIENIVSQTVSATLLAGHPIGSIEMNITGDNPSTYIGGTWVQVSQGRAVFGEGTCSTTYNVRGTSQTFSNTYTADTNYAAGLPNITGTGHYADNNNAFAGALYNAGNANYIGDGSASGTLIALDASRDRAIYGKSNTVQPNAYVVYVWKRTA